MMETCERNAASGRAAARRGQGRRAGRLHRIYGKRDRLDARPWRLGLFGAIFGSCLDVDEIQIWTDVDGMLTADPRIVPQPHLVPQLSFKEASELATSAPKCAPSTILPAVAKNIPVRILSTRGGREHRPLITPRPTTPAAA